MSGFIYVITGPMFAFKTSTLLRKVTKSRLSGKSITAFKPAVDKRYHDKKIVSHDGGSIDALPIAPEDLESIIDLSEDFDVIILDEVQFFPKKIVDICMFLADNGKHIYAAGLSTDAKRLPFGAMPDLLACADEIEMLTAVCHVCGGDAIYSQRLVDDDSLVLLGSDDVYRALCRQCWLEVE